MFVAWLYYQVIEWLYSFSGIRVYLVKCASRSKFHFSTCRRQMTEKEGEVETSRKKRAFWKRFLLSVNELSPTGCLLATMGNIHVGIYFSLFSGFPITQILLKHIQP